MFAVLCLCQRALETLTGCARSARAYPENICGVNSKLIPWQPDFFFRGHQALRQGTRYLQGLVERSKESLEK